MKTSKTGIFLTFSLFLLLFFSCAKNPSKEILKAQTELALGTVCNINLFEYGTEELYDLIFKRLHDIELSMSINIESSEINRINNAAGKNPVQVSPDIIFVLSQALYYAEKTEGAFDPTIGPLVKLWNINSESGYLPTQEEIDAVLPLVDYRLVHIDEKNSTVFLEKEGMRLDLGAIAKGYAADEAVRIAAQYKVKRALIDLGGNIYAYGSKEKDTPWRIGIKDPFSPLSTPIIRLDVENKSSVTSGVYERFFEQDGVRYHHILDPKTGYPVQNNLMSTTILCSSSMAADALSTSTFILGRESGIELLESVNADLGNEQEAATIFITDEKDIFTTKNVGAYNMLLLDESFTVR